MTFSNREMLKRYAFSDRPIEFTVHNVGILNPKPMTLRSLCVSHTFSLEHSADKSAGHGK